MPTDPIPPPEAQLIHDRREAPPKMSKRQAADRAGLSEGRWRQLENGGYKRRGRWSEEIAPPPTLAKMARAVGVTEDELRALGKDDAAAELAALPPLPPAGESAEDLFRQYLQAREEDRNKIRELEERLDHYIAREQQGQENGDEEGKQGRGRRAG
jgi:transcriptional regulator with XRE-family HTH domain